MFGLPIVSIMILLPILGALFIMATKKEDQSNAKLVALWTSFFVLLCSLVSLLEFEFLKGSLTNIHEFKRMNEYIIQYSVGLDKFSALFVPLISLINFLLILWVFKKNILRAKQFLAPVLIFESLAIGAFCANDMFLLFIFVEASIIPIVMLFCWAKDRNTGMMMQFVMYAFSSALLLLIAMILIYLETKTSNLSEIYKIGVKNRAVFWLILAGIGIKMPIWPFYYWLPTVHVKSTTVCSVLLASIVLKFSTLLLVRFIDPLFSGALYEYKDLLSIICLVSIIFSTAQLLFQDDLKRLFAYFSILHMNMYFLILLSGVGTKYFVFSIMQHSIIVTILFLLADIIQTMFKTRLVSELKLLCTSFANIKNLALISVLALIGVPFSWGFISEVLTIYSCTKISTTYAFITSFAILVSSMYVVYVYHSIFNEVQHAGSRSIDKFHISNLYKKTTLYVLFFLVVLLGIAPGLILYRL